MIPVFREQAKTGCITVTDERMTRFWLTLEQGVRFVMKALGRMHGGEIFVPKIPSMRIMDLAATMAPDCKVEYVGIRPGEKLHEVLISEDEARHTVQMDGMYIIRPEFAWFGDEQWKGATPVPKEFRLVSNTNEQWLTGKEMKALAESC